MQKYLRISKKSSTFAPAFREKLRGAIAQLVEQRTENPCVPGSIPGGTTEKKEIHSGLFFGAYRTQTGVLRRIRSVDYCLQTMLDSWWHHRKKDKYR